MPHILSGGTERQLLATFKGAADDFIAGDTLYVTVESDQTSRGGVVVSSGVTTLYALPYILSGGSQPQLLATLPGTVGSIVDAADHSQRWMSQATQGANSMRLVDLVHPAERSRRERRAMSIRMVARSILRLPSGNYDYWQVYLGLEGVCTGVVNSL